MSEQSTPEKRKLNGKRFINAYKIGYEVLLERDTFEGVEITLRNLEVSSYLIACVGSYF